MKGSNFFLILFLSIIMISSCKSRLDNPINFNYTDHNIEADASFFKFSQKENLYYGNIKIKNLNSNKEIIINKTVIRSDKKRYVIEPDYLVPIYLKINSSDSYEYKVVLDSEISSGNTSALKMIVYYTLQDIAVPSYKLKSF